MRRLLDPNPPATGSLAGIVVAGNYPGSVPPGVDETDTESVMDRREATHLGDRRLGATWRVLGDPSRVVVRGGYGV